MLLLLLLLLLGSCHSLLLTTRLVTQSCSCASISPGPVHSPGEAQANHCTLQPAILLLELQSWNFPLMEQSSSSRSGRSSSSSGSGSGSSEKGGGGGGGHATAAADKASPPPLALLPLSFQLPFVYRKQLAATRHTPVHFSGQPHHPDDWQWAAAERALRALRPTCAMAAVVALAFAAGGSWHQQAFP